MTRHLILLLAILGCSSHSEPTLTAASTPLQACYVAPPVGNIVGFGVSGQSRQWGTDGRAVKPALDMLVNDLGADFFRVEANDGETDWEATNDDADPAHFNWSAFDARFSTPKFQRLWDYVRYLNQLGVERVELSQHGGIPLWMGSNTPPSGSTQTSYPGPGDGRAYVLPAATEDEFVETCVAMLVYARTRTAAPHPQFDLFSPWNEPEFAGLGEGIDVATGAQRASILHKLVVRMNAIPELTGIQLVVGEDGNEPGMIISREAVENDPIVMARAAATSFHRYGDASTWTTWNGANPPAWLTESNSTWLSACYSTSWTMALEEAGNVISALQSGITAALAWSDYDAPHSHQGDAWQTFGLLTTTMGGLSGTQLCAFSGQPSDSVLDASTYTPKPTYYALRHLFRYVRPNASPLTLSTTGGVLAVAYQNADGTVAIFGRTSSATSSTVTLTMPNPPSYLTPRVSTSGDHDVVGDAVPLTNGQGVFSLPAHAVFTLLSSPGDGSGGVGGSGGMSAGGAPAGGAGAAAGGASSGGTAGTAGAPSGGNGGVSGSDAAGGDGSGGLPVAGQGGFGGSAGDQQATGGAGQGGAGMAGSAGTDGTGLPLVAGWAFDEGSGTTTTDASGHGHTGTIASGVTWTTTGCKFGACLSFPGSSGKNVTTPDAADLDLGTAFTIMAWVKPTTTSGWRPVLIKENGSNKEAYLFYSSPSLQGAYFTDSGNTEWSIAGGSNVSTSQWSHVAMVRDGTSLSYWVNGSQVASTTVSALPVVASSGILAIGGHTFWSGEWYSGLLDDIRCYSSALSSAEIASAMGAGL